MNYHDIQQQHHGVQQLVVSILRRKQHLSRLLIPLNVVIFMARLEVSTVTLTLEHVVLLVSIHATIKCLLCQPLESHYLCLAIVTTAQGKYIYHWIAVIAILLQSLLGIKNDPNNH